MVLSLQQIQSITLGAELIREGTSGIEFSRFTDEERALYVGRRVDKNLHMKSFAASGIQFRFSSDAKKLILKGSTAYAASRRYFAFDLFLNGVYAFSRGNHLHLDRVPPTEDLPHGQFSYEFELGEGRKEVQLFFPWSASVSLTEVSLVEGTILEPIKPKKTLLAYGDSITQGYDALYPSQSYLSRVVRELDLAVVNKGIGADVFFPELVDAPHGTQPDLITVAYGTNDWSRSKLEKFASSCRDFYLRLSRRFPAVPIFALTPIWRKDLDRETAVGDFDTIRRVVLDSVQDLADVTVVEGFDFVPHDPSFFADGYLHPNDAGFACYANQLIPFIKNKIEL